MTMPYFIILFGFFAIISNLPRFCNDIQSSRADLHSDEIFYIGNAHMNQCGMVFVKFHKRVDPETQSFIFYYKRHVK